MRILVTGRTGQLARSLALRAAGNERRELDFLSRPEIDFERPQDLASAITKLKPDAVVNAAAWTAVDQAEDEPERAQTVNAIAAGELARAARENGARFIHISTDYVFDGTKQGAYREDDTVNPLGVYGRTKAEGEQRVRAAHGQSLILRTAWVQSPFGKNFVGTMLNLARTRDRLTVVADQQGNPTSALDLADAVLAILDRWQRDPEAGAGQTLHLSGAGHTSWAGLAREVFAASAEPGGPVAEVADIASSQWPVRAPRPGNSRLDNSRIAEVFGIRMPACQDSVRETVRLLLQSGEF